MNSIATSATSPVSGCSNISGGGKPARRPRKLPEIPRKHQGLATASSAKEKSIFDEIQEALIKEVTEDEVFETETTNTTVEAFQASQYPFILKHVGHLFDKKRLLVGYNPTPSRSRNISTSSETGAGASLEEETASAHAKTRASSSSSSTLSWCSGQRRRKNSDGDGSKRYSSSFATAYQDLEVTHRGMHRFIPRHADEVQVGIGDPIHVIKEYDDLWCEGVNLRTGERGIFPAMYANDLRFLEDSDGEEADYWKFTMRYLGSVEVNAPHGDHALCQAITRVAQQGRIKTASLSTLEINQYGIRMIDKSKDGHQSNKFSHFFALKNISFCGTHPNNNRYFAFITKHPRQNRFACHVFHSDRSTHRARDALGNAFKRFYQEYMAFTHPTEDIWME
ncbi:JNK-interacting protein 1-like isoform X2 [Pomacea canaliculata]|uniref:JNK-interacting protein 1-like isoform X2 n=1 Tax=Pomacea canaliculata TaxID=400727 RepID=UPI000D732583|nr:JNK-interacting protein 1-like isoform X2 [Pomacea canaliculata]